MKNEKILIICASGIGNTILFSPALRKLKQSFPKAKINLFSTKDIFAEPVKGSNLIDEIFSFDKKNTIEKLKIILQLRREKYDYSVTAFPSNRWQFNLFAFLINAKKRVTHEYKVGKWQTFAFLQNYKVKADENLHDIEQNLNLLKVFSVNIPKDKSKIFYISEKDKEKAEKFWEKNNLINNFIVGIHPGSGGLGQNAKRLSLREFANICNELLKRQNLKILIFGGKEEEKLKNELKNIIKDKDRVITINTDLKTVASLIKKCNYFISNDSGLMHIADSLNTPLLVIYISTNEKRTKPRSKNSNYIKIAKCNIKCLPYPFYSISSRIKCNHQKNLELGEVIKNFNLFYRK